MLFGTSLLNVLLVLIGLPLVVAPGALLTAIQMPETLGRRRRPSYAVRSRWSVA